MYKYVSYVFVALLLAMSFFLLSFETSSNESCEGGLGVHVICNESFCTIQCISNNITPSDEYLLLVPSIKQEFKLDMKDGTAILELPYKNTYGAVTLVRQNNELPNNCNKTIEIFKNN